MLVSDGPHHGLYSVDRSDPEWPRLVLNEHTRYYQQAMRYIRPGMTRIGAVSRSSTLEPLAFAGERGELAVVIRGHTEGPIAIEGLPPGTYATTWTTDERVDVPGFDVDVRRGERLNTSLPGPGLLTVHAR